MPLRDTSGYEVVVEEVLIVVILLEEFLERCSKGSVYVFWWLAGLLPCAVGIEISLSPFKGHFGADWGFDGLREDVEDAGVPVETGAHEIEEDGFDASIRHCGTTGHTRSST